MIKLNIQNLFKIANKQHTISKQSNNKETNQKEELTHLNALIIEKNIDLHKNINKYTHISETQKLTKKLKDKYKHVLVIGMGGSSLGTIFLANSLLKTKSPTLDVIDYIDPDAITQTLNKLDITKTLIITISKSGGTLETMAIYQYVKEVAKQASSNYKKNFIFITEDDSKLAKYAKQENQQILPIPKEVGGRFSILTPVSLFPAELLAINTSKILDGANTMAETLKTNNPTKNIAYQFAKIQYDLFKKGKTCNIIWPYSQKLKQLSNWYRQLLAESIGKKINSNREEVFAGITPILALETTDQHSQTQLYNEGPNQNLIVFITTKQENTITIQNQDTRDTELLDINNLTLNNILKASQKATASALTKNNRPNITIEIDKITEKTIGELIIFFETSIIYLGEMLQINTFNQPGVELAKILLKTELQI